MNPPTKKRRRETSTSAQIQIQNEPDFDWAITQQPSEPQTQQQGRQNSMDQLTPPQVQEFILLFNLQLTEFENRVDVVCRELRANQVFQPNVASFLNDTKIRTYETLRLACQLYTQSLLLHTQIAELGQITISLQRQIHQIDLYTQELAYLKNPILPRPAIACLFLTQHPFPVAVKQFEVIGQPISVRLLQGALSSLAILSPVTINFESGRPDVFGGNQEDLIEGTATFRQLKPLLGTGLRANKITISVAVQQAQGGTSMLSLLLEAPMIVVTNTKQWEGAQAGLLIEELFYQNVDCSRSYFAFCNLLQKTFVTAVINGSGFKRPLAGAELQFLAHRMEPKFPSICVTELVFKQFWTWFGPILHLLKFKKFFLELWNRGLLCGFVTKETATNMLTTQKKGTFLLRFSASSAKGSLAIAYQHGNLGVRHYIFPEADLKDDGFLRFIMDCGSLLYFLKVKTDGVSELITKEDALHHIGFKPKRKPKKQDDFIGYDADILASFLTNLNV